MLRLRALAVAGIVLAVTSSCSVLGSASADGGPPTLCYPEFVFPDPSTGVTTATLRVEIQRNVLDSDPMHHIAFTSRVYVVGGLGDGGGGHPSTGPGVACRQRDVAARRLTGPTLVVVPGGALNLTIVNTLENIGHHTPNGTNLRPRLPRRHIEVGYTRAEQENHWHKINTTNLHTHGLHADPSIDDPFRRIVGGDSGHYWLPILPSEPAPALHWYHTHIHGATSLQMMGGLFGMLLVEPTASPTDASVVNLVGGGRHAAKGSGVPEQHRGDVASTPPGDATQQRKAQLKGKAATTGRKTLLARICDTAPRHTLAIHTLKFTSKRHPSPHSGWSFGDLDAALHNNVPSNPTVDVDILAVNGQFQPLMTVTRGTPVMLHMVFASSFGEAHLEVPPSCLAAVVGADGVSYRRPRRLSQDQRLHMVTATRLDVLIQCEVLGVTRVIHHIGDFDDREYLQRAQRLGMEHNVVMTLRVVEATEDGGHRRPISVGSDRDTVHWPFLENLETSMKHLDRKSGLQSSGADEDLRHISSIDLHWDLSMSQVEQRQSVANASDADPSAAATPRNASTIERRAATEPQRPPSPQHPVPPPLPYVYAIGTGPNCAPVQGEDALIVPPRNCSFEAFAGARGVQRPADYKGFVVQREGIVEARLYADPMDERPHPLHFHVNHFQIVRYTPPSGHNTTRSGHMEDALSVKWGIAVGDWRDTVPVLPGTTVIRWRASDYAGEIVYHCHTLSHEDLGMMGSYLVMPSGNNEAVPRRNERQAVQHTPPYTSWGPFAVLATIVALAAAWGCYMVPRRSRVMGGA